MPAVLEDSRDRARLASVLPSTAMEAAIRRRPGSTIRHGQQMEDRRCSSTAERRRGALPVDDARRHDTSCSIVLAASARTPVCFRAVRALTRGAVLTRAQTVSRNYRICARSRASASGIRLARPLAVAAIDRRQPAARTASFDRVWRWPTSGEWRSCRSARDGGTPGESGERHGEGDTATRSNQCRIDGTVSFAIRKLWRRPHRA